MKIFPGNNKKLIIVVLVTFLLGLFLGLSVSQPTNVLKAMLLGFPTLIAAFLGAWLAFRFQNKREDDIRQRENYESANRAIFLLARFANELEITKRQIIDPFRNRSDVALAIPAVLIPDYSDHKFDIANLAFLLQSEYADLLGELIVEETRFHQAIQAVQFRSNIHIQQVQPILEKAGVVEGQDYLWEDIKKVLGMRVYTSLERATKDAIHHVDGTIISAKEIANKLTKASKVLFPNKNVITFHIVNDK